MICPNCNNLIDDDYKFCIYCGAKLLKKEPYYFPPLSLLRKGTKQWKCSDEYLKTIAMKIKYTLEIFGIRTTITDIFCSPFIIRVEIQPEIGVRINRIIELSDEIKLNLAVPDLQIKVPIPGTTAVGIEIPNRESPIIMLRDVLESPQFVDSFSEGKILIGEDINGKVIISNLNSLSHLLIAGTVGSGKTTYIDTLIMSILYKNSPAEVRFAMIDFKAVDLSFYSSIPHLLIPIVTNLEKASRLLEWLVTEMNNRYQFFAKNNIRDFIDYKNQISSLPRIIVIINELLECNRDTSAKIEENICHLTQFASNVGIHIILASTTPINSLAKRVIRYFPSKIVFSVLTNTDSRAIIGKSGAETLFEKGDMLFWPHGNTNPIRVRGAFVTTKEIQSTVDYLKNHNSSYNQSMDDQNSFQYSSSGNSLKENEILDEFFFEAGRLVIQREKASIGMLQRFFKIGFNRSARIMEQLCEAGVVEREEGTKPREILMSLKEFEKKYHNFKIRERF